MKRLPNRFRVLVEVSLIALIVGVMAFRLGRDLSGGSRGAAPSSESPDELRERAETAYQTRNLAVATTLYADALRADPDDLRARMRLAEVFHRNAWNESALALLDEVFQRDPDHTSAHLLRAKIRRDGGDSDLALEDYRRVLAVEPTNAEALYYLGTTLHAAKRIDEAIRAYERSVSSDPDLAVPFFESVPFGIQARVLLGRIYRQLATDAINAGNRDDGMRRLDDALRLLREAASLSTPSRAGEDAQPDENARYEARAELVNALRQTAFVYRRSGDPNGLNVLAAFEEITRVDPQDMDALLEVAAIRYRTAKSRDALRRAETAAKTAFELDPLDLDAQVTLKAIRDDLALSDADLAKALE